MGRLVVIAGPSGVGKSPLLKALKRLYPELAGPLRPVVLHNSRAPRPGETDGVDYHFRRREQIEQLRGRDGFSVMDVRGDLQALDLSELAERLDGGDAVFEGNPFIGRALLDCDIPPGAERVTAFISPLRREELEFLRSDDSSADAEQTVADVMRRKLLRRTTKQKTHLSLPDLEEIERRCGSAYGELKDAWRFGWVIPNHDGEDSDNWDAFGYPLGEARQAVASVADVLGGREPRAGERWDSSVVG